MLSYLVPVVAEYERRENYDSVSMKYIAHWARKMLIDKGKENAFSLVDGYLEVTDCTNYYQDPTFCENFLKVNDISNIYVVPYSLTEFKSYVKTSGRFSRSMQEYIATLPNYENKPNAFRVIVEAKDPTTDVISYGTIEVIR